MTTQDQSPTTSPTTRPDTTRPAYAIAYLREVNFAEEIVDYLQRIDETLAPFGGRFLVHGGELIAVEGSLDGHLVVIVFPDVASATGWYESPGYQEILPLRTRNSESVAAIVEGVPAGYRAVDMLSAAGSEAQP